MKLYLAGPMTGYPELNFPSFHAEAARLRSLGHEVVNPAELNPDHTKAWTDCLKNDIKHLVDCDGIALLPGFSDSKGARLEYEIARTLEFGWIGMAKDLK